MAPRIRVTSLLVDDQEKAHAFYTEKLGFITKQDLKMEQGWWLTVASPDAPDEVELSLEPNNNPALAGAAQAYQRALFENGIPATAFAVEDIHAEVEQLKARGVQFTMEPTDVGPVIIAMLDDTCGNLIQLYQVTAQQ
ncbi:VOC family protein [Sphaerobacter sp.]|uniref:VOC family protein n=1 Tax=Sphaerobacter sp. TaxID=2099654 RepID=UPI001D76BACB|nr:VOC family protein [Sphaerobacter sp.]MBX5445750.1 VOC family protein [Sphaerobacter sp.]